MIDSFAQKSLWLLTIYRIKSKHLSLALTLSPSSPPSHLSTTGLTLLPVLAVLLLPQPGAPISPPPGIQLLHIMKAQLTGTFPIDTFLETQLEMIIALYFVLWFLSVVLTCLLDYRFLEDKIHLSV